MHPFRNIAAALVVCTSIAPGQASFQIPVTLANGGDRTRLVLGVNTGNGPGLDTAAALGKFREVPLPPMPPRPFRWSARFVSGTGRDSTFPAGLMTGTEMDFRGYASPAQVDTFVIRLDGVDGNDYPTVVSWPAGLAAHGTSWTIKPRVGRSWQATDMVASTSVTIPPRGGSEVLIIKTGATGVNTVGPGEEVAFGFQLGENYPNPFNPMTTIRYRISDIRYLKLAVYDLLGREVAKLVDGVVPAGEHAVTFDASHVASGTYFYRLEAAGKVSVRKMMVLK